MLHLNDHLYSKPCVFLWVANFQGLTVGFTSLPTLSRAFTVGHICITKNTGTFTRGGIHPCLLLLDTFSFSLIQSYDPVGRCPTVLSPPNQTPNVVLIITMHSHSFNAMSPCICNAMRYCMLYHATCIMNATWTMLKPYTSPCTMDNYTNQHKISNTFHVNIFAHTYININKPSSINQ